MRQYSSAKMEGSERQQLEQAVNVTKTCTLDAFGMQEQNQGKEVVIARVAKYSTAQQDQRRTSLTYALLPG